MSELDTLTEQFEGLLKGIRGKYTLEEWRYAYRKVIYSGAKKLLDDFPVIVIGPPPLPQHLQEQQSAPPGGGAGGRGPHPGGQPPPNLSPAGDKPPYRPSAICELVCIVVGS
jgi:hypothetical protein